MAKVGSGDKKEEYPNYYFSYGTNINPTIARKEIGTWKSRTPGRLYGYRLLFNKASLKDGGRTGFASAKFTGDFEKDFIDGALYHVTPEQIEILDVGSSAVEFDVLRGKVYRENASTDHEDEKKPAVGSISGVIDPKGNESNEQLAANVANIRASAGSVVGKDYERVVVTIVNRSVGPSEGEKTRANIWMGLPENMSKDEMLPMSRDYFEMMRPGFDIISEEHVQHLQSFVIQEGPTSARDSRSVPAASTLASTNTAGRSPPQIQAKL